MLLLLALVFRKDSSPAEIANKVERHPKRYDILEKEQAHKTQIPHVLYSGNSNDRARGTYNHGAGYEEHE